MYVVGELVAVGGGVERALVDGRATDELVDVQRLELVQLVVAGARRHDV